MSVLDLTPQPSLPDRARPFRWGYFAVRLLLVAVLLGLAAALPSGHGAQDRLRYHDGDIARERVVAPYDFRVEKDEAVLRREQQQAATAVPPVFDVDPRASSEMLDRFAGFEGKVLEAVMDPVSRPAERVLKVHELGVPLSDASAEALTAPTRARRVLRELGGWLHDIDAAGVVAEKRDGAIQGYRTISLRDGDR